MQAKTWEGFWYSHLGENIKFLHYSRRQAKKTVQGHIQFNLMQAQTSIKHFNHETEAKQ